MSLKSMLASPTTPIEEIGAWLDGLDPAGRLAEVYSLGSRDESALYVRAETAPSVGLDYFVPADRPPLTEVIHHGLNSLMAFRRFQKRFCRSEAAPDGPLMGYNEGSTRPLIGPGYFLAHTTDDSAEWADRGGVVIDYFSVPDGTVPATWPAVKSNGSGLQRFVYHQTRDFMRRVSEHVSIGAAWKNEKSLGVYFVLCREG